MLLFAPMVAVEASDKLCEARIHLRGDAKKHKRKAGLLGCRVERNTTISRLNSQRLSRDTIRQKTEVSSTLAEFIVTKTVHAKP